LQIPQTSQSPAVKEIEVISADTVEVNETAAPTSTVLDISSPTLPAAASLFVVVPMMPEVLLNVMLVALAAPRVGVTKVGDVEPAKLPVPVCPLNPTFTILLVIEFS
jgi:hypothetical protein